MRSAHHNFFFFFFFFYQNAILSLLDNTFNNTLEVKNSGLGEFQHFITW